MWRKFLRINPRAETKTEKLTKKGEKSPFFRVFCAIFTKISGKFRHFARAPTFVSAGISAFWHFSTKNEAKFMQNYLLTFSRNYVILLIESEGTTMRNAIIRFLLKKTYIDVKTLVAMLEKIKYSTTEQERKYYWEKV